MMTGKEIEIILALADSGMNVSAAGRKIFTHRNAINYHLEKIRSKTNLDPRNFYDLGELVKMAKKVISEV